MLEELDLSNCGLTMVSAALQGVCHNLQRLNLRGNKGLQLEPGCFSCLTKLKELNLSSCGLIAVKGEWSAGVALALRRLDLSSNADIWLAPGCFNSLSALEVLNLSNCGLAKIPAALLGVAPSLRQLSLLGNHLLEIEQFGCYTLLALPALELLHLQGLRSWKKDGDSSLTRFLTDCKPDRPVTSLPPPFF